ncbi:MAG TPA: hypothetical protein ENF86_01080 [Firmicutes bacterium]|nr:hypothetical protein [Bacillota bacterium]
MLKNAKGLIMAALLTCVLMVLLYAGLRSLSLKIMAFQSPLFTSPLPSPIPSYLPRGKKALLYISQRKGVPVERLVLADEFEISFPLTKKKLWKGLVLDKKGRGQFLYEVFIDAQKEVILDQVNVEEFWEAERAAYRSKFGDKALRLVARKHGIPPEKLRIVNDVIESYPLTGQKVWRVKILNAEKGLSYEITLNAFGEEVDPRAIKEAEFKAHRAKYGRLEPALYYLLKIKKPGEKVPVLIWVEGVDYEWVDKQLAKRFPELAEKYYLAGGHIIRKDGSSVRPEELGGEILDKVHSVYNDLLDRAHMEAARPIVEFLRRKGYQAKALKLFPGVFAELPKETILELNKTSLRNLGTIYWGEIEIQKELDSVSQSIRASTAWEETGYTGRGVTITIAEDGIIRPDISHRALPGSIGRVNRLGTSSERLRPLCFDVGYGEGGALLV